MIEIVAASPAHVRPIANRMREIDRIECAALGHNPKEALRLSLRSSLFAWTAKVDGRPEAMFGASARSMLDGEGSPWLLLTDDAARQAKALVRLGRRYSDGLLLEFRTLRGNVHADNATAIRWLKHLGYAIGDEFDVNGYPFRGFERTR